MSDGINFSAGLAITTAARVEHPFSSATEGARRLCGTRRLMPRERHDPLEVIEVLGVDEYLDGRRLLYSVHVHTMSLISRHADRIRLLIL